MQGTSKVCDQLGLKLLVSSHSPGSKPASQSLIPGAVWDKMFPGPLLFLNGPARVLGSGETGNFPSVHWTLRFPHYPEQTLYQDACS